MDSAENLRTVPVSHLPGIGQMKAQQMAELGIESIHDLLHHFPVRYEDRRVRPFEALVEGEMISTQALVSGTPVVRWQGKKSVLTVELRIDGKHRVNGVWFNQPWLRQKLTDGKPLVIQGRFQRQRRSIAVTATDFSLQLGNSRQSEWTPIYRGTARLTSPSLCALITAALRTYGDKLTDVLPDAAQRKYRLVSHQDAVRMMHLPQSNEQLRQAHRRLAFEEFFLFQLQLQFVRRQQFAGAGRPGRGIPADALTAFAAALPYRLTAAQQNACREIAVDLQRTQPMARLLEGDVGSGKTWVALFAAYAMWRSGNQSALMAPTELLAEQHAATAAPLLGQLGMKVCCLTGSTPTAARVQLLTELNAGDIHLIVGTHALLTDDVAFRNLGLVITDEQHRFGVSQRAALGGRGQSVDVLLLSATPIPRTLALSIYGDIDVSVLDELPAGRLPVTTRGLRMKEEDKAIRLIRRELVAGRQAYVVAPLVEESDRLPGISSASDLATAMREHFAGFRVQLLHGRMPTLDKDRVMREFVEGSVHVLVSTTVIEVGIDVANATVMLIYHAERFGLAQLHQLRGRVGRGRFPSWCLLLSDATGEMASRRLQALVEIRDGFIIAERDLELRGPGEFLGHRQSGLPEFSVGDITRDCRVMEAARDEATALLITPDFWLLPSYHRLRTEIAQVPPQRQWRH